MPASLLDRPFGIYEKALAGRALGEDAGRRATGRIRLRGDVDRRVGRSGIARLEWSREPRRDLVRAVARSRTSPIFSICLSAHRQASGWAARDAARCGTRAAEILDAAVGLACDLGIRVVQIAGYFAYYEDRRCREPRAPATSTGLRRGLASWPNAAA
jgi:L-ribulose-5-phosphate 3-epimerase